ncbi:hypothetical protein [Bacillus licheniformis]|uniref:hypothetical protein n=1 Tax=Bacillus licheniformis TaxID=1402 RepID=UPI002E1DB126|nr:hypothetical protein [Bacillus licheniformis]
MTERDLELYFKRLEYDSLSPDEKQKVNEEKERELNKRLEEQEKLLGYYSKEEIEKRNIQANLKRAEEYVKKRVG